MTTFHLSNKLGAWGEDRATEYLRSKQYRIHARNWYNPHGKRHGEIDIVAQDGVTLVFVEVKTLRATQSSTLPELQVTRDKLRKLHHICHTYIARKKLWQTPWRIDVIAIVQHDNGDFDLRHIPHVFL